MVLRAGSGIACAAMVSSPFCLHAASANLGRPWTMGFAYNLLLAFRLKQYFQEHEHQMNVHVATDALTEALTISAFDKAVVCAVFGCAYAARSRLKAQHLLPPFPALFLAVDGPPLLGTCACLRDTMQAHA